MIQGKIAEANKIREQNNEVQLKIKELEHNINKHRKDSQEAADKVHAVLTCVSQSFGTVMHFLSEVSESVISFSMIGVLLTFPLCRAVFFQVSRMLQEHEWIHSERQFFGQPNTSYDFKTNNPREAGQRLKKLEETTTKLERNVNKRAMNMLNEAEERVRMEGKGFRKLLNYTFGQCLHLLHTFSVLQYNDLMKKKRIVENDKAKILQTIKELDQKKNEALNLAWQKVYSLS